MSTLFDIRVPARRGCATQAAGAERARPGAEAEWLMILDCLACHGPLTREQICNYTGIKECAACGRLNAMADPNRGRAAWKPELPALVRVLEERRRARSGVAVQVYEITTEGRAAL